jgi:hypothetical protein
MLPKYHIRMVTTADGMGMNQDDGTISRMSLKFKLSG